MSSKGQLETQKLKQNLENQLDRLVQQLEDIEECKDDLEPEEYKETKQETLDQLKEFNESLAKMISGDMTLIDELGSMQLATQAAISAAFKTPSVIRMFARREPDQLRKRLLDLEVEKKMGRLSLVAFDREKFEILSALRQLEEKLTCEELQFLEQQRFTDKVDTASHFIKVSSSAETGHKLLEMAGSEVRAVQNL